MNRKGCRNTQTTTGEQDQPRLTQYPCTEKMAKSALQVQRVTKHVSFVSLHNFRQTIQWCLVRAPEIVSGFVRKLTVRPHIDASHTLPCIAWIDALEAKVHSKNTCESSSIYLYTNFVKYSRYNGCDILYDSISL